MNLYFLVEGRRTEKKLYPKWIGYLVPSLKRVDSPDQAKSDNYYLVSGEGFPRMLDMQLPASLLDIAATPVYSYLVIVLDADEVTPVERIEEVDRRVAETRNELAGEGINPACEIKVIVQNRCIETWLLGNRTTFRRNPTSSELRTCIDFYNVFENDPELMAKPPDSDGPIVAFHLKYLKLVLEERRIRYSKNNPGHVLEHHYVSQLSERLTETPDHLKTLKVFFDFCEALSGQITGSACNP